MDYLITLPRPRQRSHAAFASVAWKILERIMGVDETAKVADVAVSSH